MEKLDSGTLVGVTVNATNSAVLRSGGFSTLDGVKLNTDFVFDAGATVTILNGLILNGSLSGTGAFSMATVNNFIRQETGTLAFTSGVTVASTKGATLGNAAYPLVNQGTISATTSAGSITILGTTVANVGTIRLTTGGQASVENSANISGGVLTGGAWIVGGTLRLLGADITTNAARLSLDGATSRIYADTGTLDALRNFSTNASNGTFSISASRLFSIGSLTNAGYLNPSTAGTLAVAGTLTNDGIISVSQFGALSAGAIVGGGTIINNGTITLAATAPSSNQSVRGVGTLALQASQLSLKQIQQGVVALSNGARLKLSSVAKGGTINSAATLVIDSTSAIDLADTDLIVDYFGGSPLQQIRSLLISGYNGGDWQGLQLTSNAAASSSQNTALGYAEASSLKISSFKGQSVDSSTIIISYTLEGDANLDAKVNTLDFNSLAQGFGATTAGQWSGGDFDYDGDVDSIDLNLLLANYGNSFAGSVPMFGSTVPEPAMLWAIGVGLCAAKRRRKSG